MAHRGLALALLLVGCAVATLGMEWTLSVALCPPITYGIARGTVGGCVPASLIVWYGLVLLVAIPVTGFVMMGVGAVLYRRATPR